ncbi:MAG TPA: hypothetical protein VI408_05695 [Gaiellaceae bacterium]
MHARVVALLAAVVLVAVAAGGATAAPVAKRIVTVACDGTSATLIMHPGEGGSAMWDISTSDVQDGPSFLIKRIQAQVFSGGELVGAVDVTRGDKTGFGTPLSCTFEVHDPGVDVYGTSQLVHTKVPA